MNRTVSSRSRPEAPGTQQLLRSSISHLREEYEFWRSLTQEQPTSIARCIAAQAGLLGEAIMGETAHIRFTLPDEVVVEILPDASGKIGYLPAGMREQQLGGLIERIAHGRLGAAIGQRLTELEQSTDRALATGAGLLRYATVIHMVHHMLPAGRSVTYVPEEGEEIPSIPVDRSAQLPSALTAANDAVTAASVPDGVVRGELQVPYVPDARRFYLPRWVAFDGQGRLLVNSEQEAEAHLQSMQRFLRVLHAAVALAPYMVADSTYLDKRYGMLGQLVNQGRALARHETRAAIELIQQRSDARDLNRGLTISLPYFDDQDLALKVHNFEVIPAGRIMFIPGLVIWAAEQEQAKVAQDTRLSHSTQRHLLAELKELEEAFASA